MLLVDFRIRLIFLSFAGMEIAWFTPFWLLAFRPSVVSPWASYALLLALLLLWMLSLELLSRAKIATPRFEMMVIGLFLVSTLVVLQVGAGNGRNLGDLSGYRELFAGMFSFRNGFPRPLALIGANFFVWQRATAATRREPTFFNVGVSFRLGILLLALGGGIATHLGAVDLLPLVWVFFGWGLIAVSLSRVHEKAADAQSSGRPISHRRLAEVLIAIGLILTCAAALVSSIQPARFWKLILEDLAPVWRWLGARLGWFFNFLGRILEPVMQWIVDRLRELLSGGELGIRVAEPLVSPAEAELIEADPTLQAVGAAIERVASILGVLLVVATVLILLLYGLRRVRQRSLSLEEEVEEAERATYGAGILGRGVRTVRDLLDMVRRFGVSRELLAAVSIQNIYANLCRLGRYRGKERLPSQPPDDYLPTLISLFGGQEEALTRITSAYMRVHYGDEAVSLSELAQLRLDYYQIRRARRAQPGD